MEGGEQWGMETVNSDGMNSKRISISGSAGVLSEGEVGDFYKANLMSWIRSKTHPSLILHT